MITREDVARRCGVSGATVSYVLNRTPGKQISKETRKAVLDAARTLGYRPHGAARTLASGRCRQIGILGPPTEWLFHGYHAGVIRGIWRRATDRRYRVVIDAARPGEPIPYLTEHSVDGFIALGPRREVFTERVRALILRLKTPVVMVGGDDLPEFHGVRINNAQIGARAAELLLSRGHRVVAVLGGEENHDTCTERRAGFIETMRRHGVEVLPSRVAGGGYQTDTGYIAALELLRRDPAIRAVFCMDDYVAIGAFRAARELGLRVPEDLSLIGVDATESGATLSPPLTTFRQPLELMGETAFDLLLDGPDQPVKRVFETELVEGGTVARS